MSFQLQSFSLNAYIDATENHLKRKTVSVPSGAVYEMINYVKSTESGETLGEYKSVIFDPTTKYVMCFAPEKSTDMAKFIENYKPEHVIDVEQAVEGTMINLFYDWRISKWEIATKGNIGCNYWYFRTQYPNPETGEYVQWGSGSQNAHHPAVGEQTDNMCQKTFRQMFIDVFQYTNDGEYNGYGKDINDIAFLNELPKEYNYSFVLAHPDNHLVYETKLAQLTLVGVYLPIFRALTGESCNFHNNQWNEIPSVQCIQPEIYLKWDCFKQINCPILFPAKFDSSSIVSEMRLFSSGTQPIDENETNLTFNHLAQCETKLINALGFNETTMGYMIRNRTTGERMRITNPEYKMLKELRGNNPNLQYQYFCLMKAGKTKEFLTHFPAYKIQFYMFYNQYHTFISRVHQAYVSYYILKMRDSPIPKKYFIHAAKLHHDNYLPSLSQTKNIITHRVVREYFDSMEPQSILYYLNYDFHSHSK